MSWIVFQIKVVGNDKRITYTKEYIDSLQRIKLEVNGIRKNIGKKTKKNYLMNYGLGHVMMNLETIYVKKNKKKLAIRLINFLDSIINDRCK